jgi:hypothetical protein
MELTRIDKSFGVAHMVELMETQDNGRPATDG